MLRAHVYKYEVSLPRWRDELLFYQERQVNDGRKEKHDIEMQMALHYRWLPAPSSGAY